jgi:hypothetical protein
MFVVCRLIRCKNADKVDFIVKNILNDEDSNILSGESKNTCCMLVG